MTNVIRAPYTLRYLFWVGIAGFFAYQIANVRTDEFLLVLAGNAVSILALVPIGLWCHGRVAGLPIYPLLSMMYVPTFGLQFLEPSSEVVKFSIEARLQAAGSVLLYLMIATLVWLPFARRPTIPKKYWGFRGSRNNGVFLFFVSMGAAYQLVTNARWLPSELPQGVISIIRAVCLGLATLGASVLAYRAGTRSLSRESMIAFVVIFGSLLILSAAALTIVGAASMFVISVALFAVGRGKLPIAIIVMVFGALSILHAGKHPMRTKYWDRRAGLEPTAYAEFYGDWIAYGVNNLVPGSADDRRVTRTASLTDRSSLLQMLLLVQEKAPSDKPFLMGETYVIVPELMIPRILLEEKLFAHEGTTILSVYFGRQRREDTKKTTIGFGHLSEAYANFGWFGIVGLAIATGGLLGAVTRWSGAAPIDSFRGLVGLLFLGVSIQTEHTMGVTAASLSQSLQLLVLLTLLLMAPKHITEPAV